MIRNTHNLTQAFSDEMERSLRITHPGMAHWAGSGPEGKSCRHCRLMTARRNGTGICAKFRQMTSQNGKRFSFSALACRFYEERDELWRSRVAKT